MWVYDFKTRVSNHLFDITLDDSTTTSSPNRYKSENSAWDRGYTSPSCGHQLLFVTTIYLATYRKFSRVQTQF